MDAETLLLDKLATLGTEADPIREDLIGYQRMLLNRLISSDVFDYECLNLLEEADALSNFGAK